MKRREHGRADDICPLLGVLRIFGKALELKSGINGGDSACALSWQPSASKVKAVSSTSEIEVGPQVLFL